MSGASRYATQLTGCCCTSQNETTAVCAAASHGFMSLVRYLVLDAGANPDHTDGVGFTPLMR